VAVSFSKFGDLFSKQHDLARAVNNYRPALAIAERLAAADPSNLQWQIDIIEFNYDLAVSGDDATRWW
jgi:hypothetical protein